MLASNRNLYEFFIKEFFHSNCLFGSLLHIEVFSPCRLRRGNSGTRCIKCLSTLPVNLVCIIRGYTCSVMACVLTH